MYPPNLKSVALPVPEIIRGVAKLQTPNLEEGEAIGGRDGTVRKSVGELLTNALSNGTITVSSYRPFIVTFPLSLRISELLLLLFSSMPHCPTPPLVSPKFPHVPPGVGGRSPFGCKERRCWANCPCN